MKAFGRAWASGKLILAGEHAVVHGQPAIAFAVDLGSTVEITPRPGPTAIDGPIQDPKLTQAVRMVVGDHGYGVKIASTLPIGRGMGSSASLAVAIVRAWADLHDQPVDAFDAAMPLERLFHQNPSGVDVAVIARGGVLRYQRTVPPTMTSLPCPSWTAVVIDTGKVGVTADLVAGVTSRRPGIDPLLERIGALVDEATGVLHDPAALGPLLLENHTLLAQIGVSTPQLDELVGLAMAHGAHGAKLSGAGGGGVVLALIDEPAPLVAAVESLGLRAWITRPVEAP